MCDNKRANRFFLILIFYQAAVSITLSSVIYFYDMQWDIYFLQIVFQVISFFPPLVFYSVLTGEPLRVILPHKNPGIVNVLLIAGISFTVQPSAMVISAVSSFFFGNRVSELMEDMAAFSLPAVLLTVAVIPAICEEVIFRGVILSKYKSAGIKKAAIMSGLFFGIMHMDYQQFLYAFTLGVLLAYFVCYTESIYSSIIAHFIINASQTFFSLIVQLVGEHEELTAELADAGAADLAMTLLFMLPLLMITIPIFIALFRIFKSRNKANVQENEQKNSIITWEALAAFAFFILYASLNL